MIPLNGLYPLLRHLAARSNSRRLGPDHVPAVALDEHRHAERACVALALEGLELVELEDVIAAERFTQVEVQPAQVASDLAELELRAAPAEVLEEWEILLDTQTGEVVRIFPLHTHPEAAGSASTVAAQATPIPTAIGVADGRGLVFDPDPLSTAGRLYGAPYSDQNDADVAELNGELRSVDLVDITLGSDGLYRLTGPYVDIVGSTTNPTVINYTPPAEANPDAFQYGRSNNFFEAVNVYYHIDKSQRYLQTLDIGHSTQALPFRINPHGFGKIAASEYIGKVSADNGIKLANLPGRFLSRQTIN